MKKHILFLIPLLLASCGAACTARESYLIRWVNYDGQILDDAIVKKGEIPSYHGQEPTRYDSQHTYSYIFNGWNPAIHAAYSNETYTATFEKVTNYVEIRWENYDGTLLEIDNVPYGSMPEYNGPTPTIESNDSSYLFADWYPAIERATRDTTYVAQYVIFHFDTVYHWGEHGEKESHEYGPAFSIDGDDEFVYFECSQCHHIVKTRPSIESYFVDGRFYISQVNYYMEGTKDVVIPNYLYTNDGTRYPVVGFYKKESNSYTITNPFTSYTPEVENIWLPPSFETGMMNDLNNLKQVNLESTSVTTISENMFSWSGISSIKFPYSLTSIKQRAFGACKNLTSVRINGSSGSFEIGNYAFSNCDNLTDVFLSECVKYIGDYIFDYCDSLQIIYCKASSKPDRWSNLWNISRLSSSSGSRTIDVCWDSWGP